LRVWRGGRVDYDRNAVYTAQSDKGILRVWRGGRVDYDRNAVLTISNPHEIPLEFLIFAITGIDSF
jgi:hypothetical protein